MAPFISNCFHALAFAAMYAHSVQTDRNTCQSSGSCKMPVNLVNDNFKTRKPTESEKKQIDVYFKNHVDMVSESSAVKSEFRTFYLFRCTKTKEDNDAYQQLNFGNMKWALKIDGCEKYGHLLRIVRASVKRDRIVPGYDKFCPCNTGKRVNHILLSNPCKRRFGWSTQDACDTWLHFDNLPASDGSVSHVATIDMNDFESVKDRRGEIMRHVTILDQSNAARLWRKLRALTISNDANASK
eukprot:TRINITY_DN55025_c0_g1_i1.p1 TRINITY_DN55025_c0_g1~~TRINITY_DN55025_c0_g1_i1.p1  ORF type:complete len:241 (+),score=18.10 TRINITY_DN55025_c0_g1_i1:19-741(+)